MEKGNKTHKKKDRKGPRLRGEKKRREKNELKIMKGKKN